MTIRKILDVDLPALAGWVRDLPPQAGGVRLVTVDGHSGSGKSTLALALGQLLGAPVVGLEDMYPGWEGLVAGVQVAAEGVVAPFLRGESAQWQTWDWERSGPGPIRRLAPAPVVLLEGCGAGSRELLYGVSGLLWLNVPEEERAARLRRRADWSVYRPFYAAWRAQEETLYSRDKPVASADAVINKVKLPHLALQSTVSLNEARKIRLELSLPLNSRFDQP